MSLESPDSKAGLSESLALPERQNEAASDCSQSLTSFPGEYENEM